jgi:hypothetical protein
VRNLRIPSPRTFAGRGRGDAGEGFDFDEVLRHNAEARCFLFGTLTFDPLARVRLSKNAKIPFDELRVRGKILSKWISNRSG